MAAAAKTKVAVLGGGPAGVTAAFELTATPELRERYEVTVHQLGWRLGGKCASGRDLTREDRIEEHGLHVWFGFYDNAFALMQRCYRELGREPGAPLAGWRDAFEPGDEIVLYEQWDGRWISRGFQLPRNPLTPGEEREPSFWGIVQIGVSWLGGEWERLLHARRDVVAGAPGHDWEPAFVRDIASALDLELGRMRDLGATHLLRMALRLAELRHLDPFDVLPGPDAAGLSRLLETFKGWLWEHIVGPRLDDDDFRFFYMALDFWTAMVRGIVEDDLVESGFAAANGEDLRVWLARHGADRITLDHAPFIRGYYDLAFAYEGGDKSRPNMAAGAGLQALLRMLFSYKGAFVWKMQAGMGDTVFAPLYEVLRRRGVRFEFFHWVTRLGLSGDGRFVDAVEYLPQANVTGGEYEPLFDVKGLPCWPSQPDWRQLERGDELYALGVNLERDRNPLGAEPVTLRRGEEFDAVVLGIPVGALPEICVELAADPGNPRFRAMLDAARTVRTQAAQLWLDRTRGELGFAHGSNSIAGAYVEPLDTYCDMTHLAERETWPPGRDQVDVAYFCGVLMESHGDTQAAADAHVRTGVVRYLEEELDPLWPLAAARGGRGFDWSRLLDPEDRSGERRLDAQYLRSNVIGSERYVLTPAGSVQHRLWPDESGYENLYLAGDWTRNNIDGGSVEGAVSSGMLAARALTGSSDRIRGMAGWVWSEGSPRRAPARAQRAPLAADGALAARARPCYVEYGGLTSVPGPLVCQDTTLYGFWLEADHDRLTSVCEKVFRGPSGGAIDYYPFGDWVMVTFGVIDRIVAETPPFDTMGAVREPQVAIWVPTVAVRRVGPALVAERFAMFVPYIWLDNPMSVASGREVYGWAKNFGWPGLPVNGEPRVFTLDAFGMNFGPAEQPARRRLITISRSAELEEREAGVLDGPYELARDVADLLFEPADEGLVIPGLGLVTEIAHDLPRGIVREVFLKQFRAIENGLEASLQQIVEAQMRVTRLRAEPLLHEYDVIVEPLDSHPLGEELGLKNQTTRIGYRVDMDFVVETGSVLWDAATAARPSPDGAAGLSILDVLDLPVRVLGGLSRRIRDSI